MCGIAGIVNSNGAPVQPETLAGMIGLLRHRGPDAAELYTDNGAGLAHARLSIIDLEGGRQPMQNEDGSLWITFNGEIFNYLELREELIAKGHQFRTRSDTEVILHLYEEKGEECVRYLNGQWAFAILDSRRRSVLLSRDRLGVRPLFYSLAAGALVFASEVKAIFAHPEIRRELDLEGLDEVFTYWCTLAPRTLFQGVYELPPGHSMRFEAGAVSIWRYWELEYGAEAGLPVDAAREKKYAEDLLSLLIDATRIRLRADVPVGAYLSGGLDSTLTTALIRNFTQAPLRTFSVTFEDAEFDESAYQQEAVRFLGTDHQDLRCTAGDIAGAFPEVIWHAEKPILRTAPAPLYLLSGLVRRSGYKVVVTGEGSDEILGGYDIFKEAKIRRFWSAQPGSKMRPLLLRRLYPYLRNIQSQPDAYRKAFFHIDVAAELAPLFSHIPRWDLTARIKTLFSDACATAAAPDRYRRVRDSLPRGYASWPAFCQAQYLETKHLLPGYILSSQGDRVAMAHSVEGRFPFLDHRVVEFASKVPVGLKMKALTEKYLLKRAAVGLIPRSILERRKQPYRAPEGSSFLQPEAREYVEDLLSEDRIRRDGLFDAGSVTKLLDKFRKGAAIGIKDNMGLVGVIATQLLVHHFINNYAARLATHEERSAAVRSGRVSVRQGEHILSR